MKQNYNLKKPNLMKVSGEWQTLDLTEQWGEKVKECMKMNTFENMTKCLGLYIGKCQIKYNAYNVWVKYWANVKKSLHVLFQKRKIRE